MASVHDFFEGQVDRDLFYWHYHSGETRLSKKKNVMFKRVAFLHLTTVSPCNLKKYDHIYANLTDPPSLGLPLRVGQQHKDHGLAQKY